MIAPLLAALALALSGCDRPQSWAAPRGVDAAAVSQLFTVMLTAAGAIWIVVVGLMIYSASVRPGAHSGLLARRFVVWGGMVFPTVTLLSLLIYGLGMMRATAAREPDLAIRATGEQWWWRLDYRTPEGEWVSAPNELRLPVGRTVEIALAADDVIHSFWAPSLGGKVDMIPGRVNRLTLTPTETGVFRGQCAEFCGAAHAQMAFPVVVMEPGAWSEWLARQAEPVAAPDESPLGAGYAAFLSAGCGACHMIRGTEAAGGVGPDLTHVGSRLTIGAGLLPMSAENLELWIARTAEVKPGVRMPSFHMLPEAEIRAIALWLASLE